MINLQEPKKTLWDPKYMIDNLPPWLYTDNEEPTSLVECEAKVKSLEFTLQDIDLQIQIRELELKTGSSRYGSSFEFEKWQAQALKAKQTHLYLLNAYTYWFLLNKEPSSETGEYKNFKKLIQILIEDPTDIVEQLTKLL